ncbi:MarR family winged helix-turn-helix transcriptional regulator [Cupriavidus sp. AU9028]|uniref:MarR family winged helix-turn-helix transcriptional regulator n=1 Tax=Cupriavidus sp. AU9028 TaxID=2871157 RepID=UPI001C97A126|nr:MarR family transcriptional regulator [Cupriavidus sp. AU9028]MBY4896772.1 MarR family transcriptional regulator [Cupriavidus sp. AU9028]
MPTSRHTRPVSPDPAAEQPGHLRDPRDITELLNFRLAALVGASGAAVIRLCEGQYGVSRREWALLGLLALRGAQAPSAIADQCHLDRTRVSRAITRLTAKGLVRRQTLDGDRRRASVALTDAGHALYRQLFGEVAAINRRLVETLSDAELASLDTLLTRLTEQADRVRGEVATSVRTNRWAGGAGRRQWVAPEAKV